MAMALVVGHSLSQQPPMLSNPLLIPLLAGVAAQLVEMIRRKGSIVLWRVTLAGSKIHDAERLAFCNGSTCQTRHHHWQECACLLLDVSCCHCGRAGIHWLGRYIGCHDGVDKYAGVVHLGWHWTLGAHHNLNTNHGAIAIKYTLWLIQGCWRRL